MATEVAAPTRWLADQWENNCGYSSAVLSGIVPDDRHKDNGGYHCSINDLVAYGNAGDYSNRRTLDKAPPVTTVGKRYAAAVDMSLSRADMQRLYGRAKRVFDDRTDPRRKYLNAINVWDGIDGHSPRRLDFQANTNSTASADHTWHSHEDQPRAYVDVNRSEAEAWTAARAFVSMVKGETVAQWLASTAPAPNVEEPDMDATQAKQLAEVHAALLNPDKGMDKRHLVQLIKDVAFVLIKGPAGSGAWVGGALTRIAEASGIDAAELEQISAAARQGSEAGAAEVLSRLTPEAIAAAIPPELAEQVADELASRLAS